MSQRALVGAAAVGVAVLLCIGVAWTTTTRPTQSPRAAEVARVDVRAGRRTEAPRRIDTARTGTTGVSAGGHRRDGEDEAVLESWSLFVQTAEGAPIVGALVAAKRFLGSTTRDVATTDGTGKARLTVGESDDVSVSADGFVPRIVHDAASIDVVTLKRFVSIAGAVVDSDDRPIALAEVSADSNGSCAVQTDADGRFRLDVDPDAQSVAVTVGRVDLREWRDRRAPGDLDVRVVLTRPCSIEGHLVLPDGRAPATGSVDGIDVHGGVFALDGMTVGEHLLRAWASVDGRSYEAEFAVRLADGETLRDVRIVLHECPRSFAVLRVVGADGAPVTFAEARAENSGGAAEAAGGFVVVPVEARPGSDARVTFFRAASGDVEYGDLHFDVVTRATPEGEPLVVELPRMSFLEIVVVWPDLVQPRALVRLEQTAGPSLHVEAQPSDMSRCTFRVALGGAYRVHVESGEFAPTTREITAEELVAGKAVVRMSRGATVKVRLVARPPARLTEPWIVLGADGASPWRRVPAHGVREDGAYALDCLPAGKCEAQFVCCGSIVEKTATIDVPESGVLDLGDVVLDGTTTLAGRVVAPDGRPAGGAEINYYDRRRLMDVDGVHAMSRSDGTFAIDVPVGATGDLCVKKSDLGGVMIPLDGKGAWTEARLQPECRLRLVFRAKSPRGWEPSSVALARPGGTGLWCPPLDGERRTLDDGTIEVRRGLAPGKWIVRLHEQTPAIEREVALVAGETTEVVIDEP